MQYLYILENKFNILEVNYMGQNYETQNITTNSILNVLSDEWQTIKHLIFKLKIRDIMDARYLQLKLKDLEREGQVLVEVKMGRKHWKLNPHQKVIQSKAEILSKLKRIEEKFEREWKNRISKGESQRIEFKSSLKYDYQTKKANITLQIEIIKTIAGFLNFEGGTLFIGVDDNGNILGLKKDYKLLGRKKDFDGFLIQLNNLIKKHFRGNIFADLNILSQKIEGKEICIIDVEKSSIPIFLKPEGEFYIRSGTSTNKLNTEDSVLYIKNHFKIW